MPNELKESVIGFDALAKIMTEATSGKVVIDREYAIEGAHYLVIEYDVILIKTNSLDVLRGFVVGWVFAKEHQHT